MPIADREAANKPPPTPPPGGAGFRKELSNICGVSWVARNALTV